MLKPRATERMRAAIPVGDWTPAGPEGPDCRALIVIWNFLLAGFGHIRRTRIAPTIPPAAWPDEWEDEEYIYLETRIPGDTSGMELDLNVYHGVIFARIRRRRDDAGAEPVPPGADEIGRACGE